MRNLETFVSRISEAWHEHGLRGTSSSALRFDGCEGYNLTAHSDQGVDPKAVERILEQVACEHGLKPKPGINGIGTWQLNAQKSATSVPLWLVAQTVLPTRVSLIIKATAPPPKPFRRRKRAYQ